MTIAQQEAQPSLTLHKRDRHQRNDSRRRLRSGGPLQALTNSRRRKPSSGKKQPPDLGTLSTFVPTTTSTARKATPAKGPVDCTICCQGIYFPSSPDGCEHCFCLQCIFELSQTQNTCPVCGARFDCIVLDDAVHNLRAEPLDRADVNDLIRSAIQSLDITATNGSLKPSLVTLPTGRRCVDWSSLDTVFGLRREVTGCDEVEQTNRALQSLWTVVRDRTLGRLPDSP